MRLTLWMLFSVFLLSSPLVHAADKPNIVLVSLDNFGWGEPGFNGGGIVRCARNHRSSLEPRIGIY